MCPRCGHVLANQTLLVYKFLGLGTSVLVVIGFFVLALALGIYLSGFGPEPSTASVALEGRIRHTVRNVGAEVTQVKLVERQAEAGGGYLADIAYMSTSESGSRSIMFFEAREILKELYTDPVLDQVQKCVLRPHLTLTDEYNNSRVFQVGKLALSRQVADGIRWQDIGADMLERILRKEGDFWLHSAME
jgi:hypothetical protein